MGRGRKRRGQGRPTMQVPSPTEERKLKSEVRRVEMEEDDADEGEEEMVVKWASHYSSVQDILLVGEGDFSFSLCLASAFGSASNIVATSLDSYDTLLKKYGRAKSNLKRLKEMGATIVHEVDATKMKFHMYLKTRKFDRIVFNFPHAGFKGKEDNMRLINLHKQLVNGFFKNASHMLRPWGEVHVSHKIGVPFCKWNLQELALKSSLVLTERAKFSIDDYPGYHNKRGDGDRCDHPFPLGECRTFKFRIGNIHESKRRKEGISTTRATNISSNDLRARMSNSSCHQLRFGSHSLHQVHPKIENPLMADYQPYVSEALPNDVLFRYLKHQEEVRNQNNLGRHRVLNIENPWRVCYQPYANRASLNGVHPNIENPWRVGHHRSYANEAFLNDERLNIETSRLGYQTYVNEEFRNDVLFGYLKRQIEVQNQQTSARLGGLFLMHAPDEEPGRFGQSY